MQTTSSTSTRAPFVLAPAPTLILSRLIEPNAPERYMFCFQCNETTIHRLLRTKDGMKKYTCKCGGFNWYMITRPTKE